MTGNILVKIWQFKLILQNEWRQKSTACTNIEANDLLKSVFWFKQDLIQFVSWLNCTKKLQKKPANKKQNKITTKMPKVLVETLWQSNLPMLLNLLYCGAVFVYFNLKWVSGVPIKSSSINVSWNKTFIQNHHSVYLSKNSYKTAFKFTLL